MTVRELFKFVVDNDISLDAKVYVQRVEDVYFEGHDISGMSGTLPDGTSGILPPGSRSRGWDVLRMPGMGYHNAVAWNEYVVANTVKGSEALKPYSEEELLQLYDQYVHVESTVGYKDPTKLFLTPHY